MVTIMWYNRFIPLLLVMAIMPAQAMDLTTSETHFPKDLPTTAYEVHYDDYPNGTLLEYEQLNVDLNHDGEDDQIYLGVFDHYYWVEQVFEIWMSVGGNSVTIYKQILDGTPFSFIIEFDGRIALAKTKSNEELEIDWLTLSKEWVNQNYPKNTWEQIIDGTLVIE